MKIVAPPPVREKEKINAALENPALSSQFPAVCQAAKDNGLEDDIMIG